MSEPEPCSLPQSIAPYYLSLTLWALKLKMGESSPKSGNEKQAKCSDIRTYIAEMGKTVENLDDKQLIMEACIQVALADKVLDTKEVAVLLMICRALNCGLERFVCDIAIFAQNDRSIKIEGSDANFDEDEITEEEN